MRETNELCEACGLPLNGDGTDTRLYRVDFFMGKLLPPWHYFHLICPEDVPEDTDRAAQTNPLD